MAAHDPVVPQVDVRRSPDRAVTTTDGIRSRHSFSFGRHYDPADISYGVLLAHNEDVISPGAGYPLHPHRDLEIVTWLLQGVLLHEDSTGAAHELVPGSVQRLSAGPGLRHSEHAAAGDPVHLVQLWLRSDGAGLDPAYAQRDVTAELAAGRLVPLASGLPGQRGTAALRIASSRAAVHAARPAAGTGVELPDAPYVHLFVATGEVELEGIGDLQPGDAVRLTAAGARRVTAPAQAEILVCEMHAP